MKSIAEEIPNEDSINRNKEGKSTSKNTTTYIPIKKTSTKIGILIEDFKTNPI